MKNMKKFVLSIYILTVLIFSSCGFIEGIIPPAKEPFGRSRGNIAYIFENNKQNGVEFRYFLEESNYFTEIININVVMNTDLSDYELIIIDSDSGSGYNWGTQQIVDVLKGSNKPIIGLGEGGARFFQSVGISINWANSMLFNDLSIYVVDPAHPVFTEPETVEISLTTNIIQLYSDPDTMTIGVYANNLTSSVTRLGYSESNENHYPLVQEGRFLLWGFYTHYIHTPYSHTPRSMTNNGKKLFSNIVYYLINSY